MFQSKPKSGVLRQVESGLTHETQIDMLLPFCRAGCGFKVEGSDSCVLFLFYESIL
jgi:hypothetical protein